MSACSLLHRHVFNDRLLLARDISSVVCKSLVKSNDDTAIVNLITLLEAICSMSKQVEPVESIMTDLYSELGDYAIPISTSNMHTFT